MDLQERLSHNRPSTAAPKVDQFAEVKNRVHMAVIGGLGPQLSNVDIDPAAMRDRVMADIDAQLSNETGIAREDRRRLASEIADDILGHGPLERPLADESITEIMINGAHDIW